MKISILTLFPHFFESPLEESILKRAQNQSTIKFNLINIRDFATDKHKVTDDRPFGGGPGMVMKVEPIFKALMSLDALESSGGRQGKRKLDDSKVVVLTSAKGSLFTQESAQGFVSKDELIIICGHYEGVDERIAENLIDYEMRIGDFVITGGEPAALVIADAVARLIPGVLGNVESNQGESHDIPGQLGFPQFTRPEKFNDWPVPEVLLQGNHALITKWREDNRG